jgi:hypothetical protein
MASRSSRLPREEVVYQRARLARRALTLAHLLLGGALWLQRSRGASVLLIALLFVATTALVIASSWTEYRAARRSRQAFDHLDRVIGRS